MSFQSKQDEVDPATCWAHFFFLTALALICVAAFFEWFDEPYPGFERRGAFLFAVLAAWCIYQSFREAIKSKSDRSGVVIIFCTNWYAWLLLPHVISWTISGLTAAFVILLLGFLGYLETGSRRGWFVENNQ